MRLILAILLGKLIFYLTRFLKIGGGSAAPGLYALKIEPKLIEKLKLQITRNIVITGTNGKTTTSKVLAHFAKKAKLKVIRNHTGSNLERGIASSLIRNARLNLKGVKLNYNLGIWELDEAAFNHVAPKLKPNITVFLNVFRDQLDRYGEIDTVVNKWCQALQEISSKTTILINGDDNNLLKLTKCFKEKVQKFGIESNKITGESIMHAIKSVGFNFEAKKIKLNGLKSSTFQLHTANFVLPTTLPLPGFYHIYDFLAAFAAGINIGLQPKQMITSLQEYSPAFGRVEKFPLPRLGSGKEGFGYIFLIKNPAGATQVLETIAPVLKPEDVLLLALNDNIADGKDISWIWDIKLENKLHLPQIRYIASGTRAYDLVVRLKYAGIRPNTINIETDLKKALGVARTGLKGQLFVLPTYTAMLELQSILTKSGIKKHYWRDE